MLNIASMYQSVVSLLPEGHRLRRMLESTHYQQMAIYFCIGGTTSIINVVIFTALYHVHIGTIPSAIAAYVISAYTNYQFCLRWAFKEPSRWNKNTEFLLYITVVCVMCAFDVYITTIIIALLSSAVITKSLTCAIGYLINFSLRKYIVFKK